MTTLQTEIRRFVVDNFMFGQNDEKLGNSDSFLESGIIDSTGVLELIAFLESTSYEDAIRNAISLGGDADTLACITGGVAEAYYGGVPQEIADRVTALLDDKMTSVLKRFRDRFHLP